MKPLIFWRWNRLPSLREIDNQILSFAKRGFGKAVIFSSEGFLSAKWFEALRGSCRSACRHGIRLFAADDTGSFSGHGGGEVVSVPELRASALLLLDETGLRCGEEPILRRGGKAVVVRRAEPRNGICPVDVFNPRAAREFTSSVHRRIKREAARFIGYELEGFYTKNAFSPEFWGTDNLPYSERLAVYLKERGLDPIASAEELFFGGGELRREYENAAAALCGEVFYSHLKNYCDESGLVLLGEAESVLVKPVHAVGSGSFAELGAALSEGARLIAADGDSSASDGLYAPSFSAFRPCADRDRLWTAAVDKATEHIRACEEPQGLEILGEDGMPASEIKQGGGLIVNTSDESVSVILKCGSKASLLDPINGDSRFLSTDGIKAVFEGGGFALLDCGEGGSAQYLRTGVTFAKLKKPKRLPLRLVEAGVNTLRLGCGGRFEFEVQFVGGELYAAAPEGVCLSLNGNRLAPTGEFISPGLVRFPITGAVGMGVNIITANPPSAVFIAGDLSTDGKKIIPPCTGAVGGAAQCGMPHYAGALKYEALLPDELPEGACLRLCGSFPYAEVKIGRRREALAAKPYLLPLYMADAGRKAEITLYSDFRSLFSSDAEIPFGLDAAELV